MNHPFAGVTRNRVLLLEEDGLLGTHFFAQATIDAADHVDLEFLGALLDFCPEKTAGPGALVIARGGQMNSQSWQATQRSLPCSSLTNAGAPRYQEGSWESHRSSGYCIVALVLPETSFLRCFKVIASPVDDRGRVELLRRDSIWDV